MNKLTLTPVPLARLLLLSLAILMLFFVSGLSAWAQVTNLPPDCSTNSQSVTYECGYSCTTNMCFDANDNGPSCVSGGADGSGSDVCDSADGDGDGDSEDGDGDDETDEPCQDGMPYWRVEEPQISLYVGDRPLFYRTSRGRKITFQIHYKGTPGLNGGTDNLQPAIFSVGTNWHSPWRSYMQQSMIDQAGTPTFFIFLGDGSARQYTRDRVEPQSRATLTFTNGEYSLTFPSGSRNIYGQFVTMSGNEYIFLTRKEDSSSNGTAFSYTFTTGGGATNSVRLDKVTDEDSRETTFLYTNNGYYSNLITQVLAPYSLTAKLAFDSQSRLTNVTDVVNLSSRIEYNSNDRVSKVITPYGTNSFTYIATNGSTALLVDKLGLRKQFYLGGHDRNNVLSTASSESAALNTYLGSSSTVQINLFDVRNTFYWGPRQYQNIPSAIRSAISGGSFDPANLTTNDLKLGRTRHWLRGRTSSSSNTNVILSATKSLQRAPSPDTNGVTEGLITWYDYEGKNDSADFTDKWEYAPTNKLPKSVAFHIPGGNWESNPGGEWQVTKYTRNSAGKPTVREQTYAVSDKVDWAYTWGTAWRTNSFIYADNGVDLLSSHFSSTNETHLQSSNVFNAYHQVTTNYNALEEATVFEYNSSHQLTKATYPSGLIADYTYDGNGFLASKVERSLAQDFRTNSYTWNNGRLHTHTDPRRSVTTNTWDALGRLTQTANESGANNLSWTNLDLVRTTDRMGFTNGYAYNGFRELIRQTNANFKVTTYEYCDCGVLESVLDAMNNRTSYSYDNLGRLLRTTFPDNSWSENTYDLLNQNIRTVDSAGSSVTNTYLRGGLLTIRQSALGAVLRVFYDAEDRATNTMDGNGVLTLHSYDALGRVITSDVVNYDPYFDTLDFGTHHINSFGYSARGLIAHTNPLEQITRYFYDELGRKTLETNALGDKTQFTYAPAGDLLTLIDAKSQTTTWKYDLLGRVTNKLDAATAESFRYAYDANGRLTSRWTPAKSFTAYSYDAMGNLTLVNYPASSDVTRTYDALNRVSTMLDAVGTTTYAYTNFGAIQSENGPWENDTVSYTYANQRRTGMSVAQVTGAAWTQSYVYDVAQRLTNITSAAGAFGYGYRAFANWAEYFPGGGQMPLAGSLVERIALPHGSEITRIHDVMGRVSGTYLKNGGGTVTNKHEYAYDNAHRRTNQVRTAGDHVGYAYDNIGQLRTAFGLESGGTTNRVHERLGYTYDAAGNLNYRTNNALVQTFNVNNLNQLTSGTRSGNMTVAGGTTVNATSVDVADNGNSAVAAIRYADRSFARTNVTLLDGNNTFVALAQDSLGRTDSNTVTVNLAATVSFLYDLNGNLRTNGTRILSYDDENQLTGTWVSGVSSNWFVYDGKMRRRIRKEYIWQNGAFQPVEEVRYVYDGNLVVQERHYDLRVPLTLPSSIVSYTRGLDLSGSLQRAGGIGGLLARSEQSTLNFQPSTAFYHSDANGNVTAMVDTNQTLVARYLYDPFGGLLARSGLLADANLYRFSSKEVSDASGLVYYLYRYYEPQLQRWVNRDPTGEAGGLNLYTVLNNAPVDCIDLFGLDVEFRGTGKDRNTVEDAYSEIKNTKKGKELCEQLEKSPDKYIVRAGKGDPHYDPKTKTITVDPNAYPVVETTAGKQPAPIQATLAHEIGHAATGAKDDGPGRMNNVNQNENPIRDQLNLPRRIKY